MRTGLGYDIHRLIPTLTGGTLPVGGVPIPCFFKVQAHSDGDVLLHALTDALLGALALGDIGQWFPDRDPVNKGRSSADFVKAARAKIRELGWQVHQLDSIVFLEMPKLAPHSDAIREALARLLGIELTSVSVKAKTMEGLGPIGENGAIAAQVVVTLEEIRAHGPSAHQ